MSDERRVVITGLGLVTPVGKDRDSAWQALLDGVSGAAPVSRFDPPEDLSVRFACEVDDFEPEEYLDRKEVKRTDRFSQFALAATEQAVEHADIRATFEESDPERTGVIVGSGIGGLETLEEQHKRMLDRGPDRVSPFFIPMFIADMAPGLISMRYGARGPNYATVSACASSAHAVGLALRSVRNGEADVMIAGGAEATITPLCMGGFASMRALSTRNDDPESASRPFDRHRDGFVLGEGSGALILESLEHARERGADILAEAAGFGQSADAHHMTAPAPGGEGAQLAMREALEDAGVETTDVDYVNAHGTSTPQNDSTETEAIKSVFGDHAYDLVVGSTKSMTGHTLGAAGAVESVICAQVCREDLIPPTINFEEKDPDCDLDYAHHGAVEREVDVALSNSFGFGGHNVSLILRKWQEG